MVPTRLEMLNVEISHLYSTQVDVTILPNVTVTQCGPTCGISYSAFLLVLLEEMGATHL